MEPTNNFSNCALQIDNRSSIDLCIENIEGTVLEKSDPQKTLDLLIEKSNDNTDEDSCELCLIHTDES